MVTPLPPVNTTQGAQTMGDLMEDMVGVTVIPTAIMEEAEDTMVVILLREAQDMQVRHGLQEINNKLSRIRESLDNSSQRLEIQPHNNIFHCLRVNIANTLPRRHTLLRVRVRLNRIKRRLIIPTMKLFNNNSFHHIN